MLNEACIHVSKCTTMMPIKSMVPQFETSFCFFWYKNTEIKTIEVSKWQSNSLSIFKQTFEKNGLWTMTRAKPHFHHEIKFSISNFQLLNCQRGKLAGELTNKLFLIENLRLRIEQTSVRRWQIGWKSIMMRNVCVETYLELHVFEY